MKRRDVLKLGAASLLTSAACSPKDPLERGRTSASLWFSYGGKNRSVLEKLVTRFNESQSEYYVRPVYQGDYYEGLAKLRTAIAARVAPALSHVVGEVIPYLAEAGVLESLGGYPGARELDIIAELGQRKTWENGHTHPLVCLPFNRSTPIAYLNAELFAQKGLAAPKTWDELRSTARALTERSGEKTTRFGFGCPISWWFWVALVGQAGGRVIDHAGNATLGGEAGVEALELWKSLVEARVMKPPPGRDYNAWEQTNQDFLAGRTAMIWTSTAFLRYLEENARFAVRAAPLPEKVTHFVPTGGTHWIIPKAAKELEKPAAWAFLRFMQEPEQVVTWATETGYMPTTHGAVRLLEARGFYENHPNDRVAVDQLAVARPWPWSPELFRLEREIVQPRLEAAILGRRASREALDEARSLAQHAFRGASGSEGGVR